MPRCRSFSRLLFLLCFAIAARLGQPFTSPYLPERIIIGVSESFAPDRLTHEVTRLFVSHGSRSKSVYASKHGYDFTFISHGTGTGHMNWNRLYWARKQLGIRGLNSTQQIPLCSRYDWVVWMDNDIFITNATVKIEDLIEEAIRLHGGELPDFIANIDAAHNLNTGIGIVRCSVGGLRFLNHMLELKDTHGHVDVIRGLDHNGAIIYSHQHDQWVRDLTALLPAKRMNAYMWAQNGAPEACPSGPTCDEGYWSPGDFLIHFAGDGKHRVVSWIAKFPPHTWIGYMDDFPIV